MIRALSADIAHSQLSALIQDHVWVVPAVQSIHILAIAALVFAAFSANLAVLRRPAGTPATPWLAGSYRWTWTALAVLLASGTILLIGEPTRSLMNVFFRAKIVLVIVATALTLVLQRTLATHPDHARGGIASIVIAALSILAWTAIIFCGRFIAYFGNLAE